jgi:light-regulated signal transduction histidine kinase (bacteriophytochrome)
MYGNILRSDFSGYLPEKGNVYLDKIQRAANRISAMIDGVLQYSSVEAFDQAFESIDINVIIDSIREDLEIVLKESGATINQERLPVIKGSPTLIHQLFYNLINNSLKFRIPDRKPIISIQYCDASQEELAKLNLTDEHIKIDLQDNGIGFDQIYAARIFESFARLNPKDKYEGTGLGLALCKKIVLRHGGCITATGIINEGALFSIFLPKTILIN